LAEDEESFVGGEGGFVVAVDPAEKDGAENSAELFDTL
jgi:hypothetical protein